MSVEEMESYRDLVLENIEYDHLCREFTTYREDLDEIVELIVETVCARRKTTRIAGADFPHEVVRSRFLKLDSSHIEFVISKYMAHRREKKLEKQRSRDSPVTPKGKQTVKQLIGQNQGVSNIEINDPSIKDFERIARKYGVDYAVKKDRSASPPKYLIFFKARDADALTAAFSEYTQKKVKKADRSERPSVLEKLAQFKELLKNTVVDRSRRKELER